MQRDFEQKLIAWKTSPSRKPVILKGVRQVGKTWLLKSFGETAFAQSHYVNLEVHTELKQVFIETRDPAQIIRELEFLLRTRINTRTDLLILDEIQAVPEALTALKYFYESLPELAICSAGSLIGTFLSEVPFPVGKATIMELHPMTFSEFLRAQRESALVQLLEEHDLKRPFPHIPHTRLSEFWRMYLVTGGMPEAVSAAVEHDGTTYIAGQKARSIHDQLVMAYLADMAKHAGQINAHHLERIYRSVPIQLARSMDTGTSRFMFKGVIPGMKGYARMAGAITWLEKAGLINRVPLLHHVESPLKAFSKENMFKLYLSDVGILGSASDLPPATVLNYDFATYKGYFVENAILQEIVATQLKAFCWEGRTAEVEFVVQHEDRIIPIEVKAGNRTKSKSLSVYRSKYNPDFTITITNANRGMEGTSLKIPHYATGQLSRELGKLMRF